MPVATFMRKACMLPHMHAAPAVIQTLCSPQCDHTPCALCSQTSLQSWMRGHLILLVRPQVVDSEHFALHLQGCCTAASWCGCGGSLTKDPHMACTQNNRQLVVRLSSGGLVDLTNLCCLSSRNRTYRTCRRRPSTTIAPSLRGCRLTSATPRNGMPGGRQGTCTCGTSIRNDMHPIVHCSAWREPVARIHPAACNS